MEPDGPVATVAFSPDGKRLVTASRDKTVRLWDTTTCKPLGTPIRHDETVLRAIFNPDATKVLSVGWDGAAYLRDAAVPVWPGDILPIPGQVRSIEFDENDDRVFVATRDRQAGLWSLSKREFVTPVAIIAMRLPRPFFTHQADNSRLLAQMGSFVFGTP